jgi:hypothetical protein
MSTDNVTPIRPAGPVQDRFDDIYDSMQAQLNALRCVLAVLDTAETVDEDEDLAAARGLFHQTFRELDDLHSELAEWHKETRT